MDMSNFLWHLFYTDPVSTWFFFRTCSQNIVTWCNLIIKCCMCAHTYLPWTDSMASYLHMDGLGSSDWNPAYIRLTAYGQRLLRGDCQHFFGDLNIPQASMHDNRSKKLCSKARTTSKYCLIDLFDSITNSFFSLSAPLSAVSSLPHFFTHFPNPLGRFTHWVPLDLSLPCAMRHAAMPPCHARRGYPAIPWCWRG